MIKVEDEYRTVSLTLVPEPFLNKKDAENP